MLVDVVDVQMPGWLSAEPAAPRVGALKRALSAAAGASEFERNTPGQDACPCPINHAHAAAAEVPHTS